MKTGGDSPEASRGSQGAFRPAAIARWLPWIAVPYGIALVLLLARQPDVAGLLHDDGVYLSMARSIARGDGPVDGHMIESARTSRFPPLHPALLAAATPIVGGATDAGVPPVARPIARLVALNGVWLAIALAAFLRWVARFKEWPPWLALSAAACVFTLPYVLGLAQHLMSESLFLAELGVATLLVERAGRRGTRGALAAAGLAAGLLPATRAAGGIVVVGFALWLLLRARRPVRSFALSAAAVWVAAAAWSFAARSVTVADSPLFGPDYLRLIAPLRELPWIAWVNLIRFGDHAWTLLATSAPPASGATSAAVRFALAIAAIVALVLGARRRRFGVELCVLAPSLLLLLPWPFPDLRFLVPFAGLGVVALVEATRGVRLHAVAWSASLLGLAAWNAPLARRCFAARGDEAPFFFAPPVPLAPLREAAGWLAANTAPDAAFAATLDPTFHFLSGRPGVSAWVNDRPVAENYFDRATAWRTLYGGPPSRAAMQELYASADRVLAEYRRLGVRHVVHLRSGSAGAPTYETLVDHLVRTDAATARHFMRVFTSRDGSIEIWRFDGAP